MPYSKSPQFRNVKRFSFPFSSKAFGCVLLAAFQTVAGAQTSVATFRPLIQPGTLAEQSSSEAALHIQIIEGDRGVNIIKRKTAVEPVIEVRDRNNLPVAGAVVTFTAPNDGPSIVFLNGSRSITVIAEANGRATTVGLKPVNVGNFQISVSATSDSQTATATIPMTNVLTAAAAAGVAGGTVASASATSGGLSGGMIGLIVGVAAAAAVGIGVGLTHHGSSSTSATSIGVGTGTVGAPH